jgi:acyl-CoA thioester hydrolase
MGVVYHANYLRYFEIARVELLRGAGFPHRDLEERGVLFVVSETGIKYVGSARYDDVIEIRAWIADVGKASVRFEYEARLLPDRVLAAGFTVLACVGPSGKVMRLPAEMAEKLSEPVDLPFVGGKDGIPLVY